MLRCSATRVVSSTATEPCQNKIVTEIIGKGTWVEIRHVVLVADQRAPQLPEDTRRAPLEMRVKGFLAEAAHVGDEVEIVTAIGRRLHGQLTEINPAYEHGFGQPVPALSSIASEVRGILRGRPQSE